MEKLGDNLEIRLFRKDEIPKTGVVVVIDCYLATSNLVLLAQKGLRNLVIVNEDNLDLAKAKFKKGVVVGESFLRIKFDVSNSSLEIAKANLLDCDVLYTTINGTKALESVDFSGCAEVLVGSFLNLSATAEYLRANHGGVKVIFYVAGEAGKYLLEDRRCARLLADKIQGKDFDWLPLREELRKFIESYYGGWESDIDFSLALDSAPLVLACRPRDGFLKVDRVLPAPV